MTIAANVFACRSAAPTISLECERSEDTQALPPVHARHLGRSATTAFTPAKRSLHASCWLLFAARQRMFSQPRRSTGKMLASKEIFRIFTGFSRRPFLSRPPICGAIFAFFLPAFAFPRCLRQPPQIATNVSRMLKLPAIGECQRSADTRLQTPGIWVEALRLHLRPQSGAAMRLLVAVKWYPP